jgi:hypothetical protein
MRAPGSLGLTGRALVISLAAKTRLDYRTPQTKGKPCG